MREDYFLEFNSNHNTRERERKRQNESDARTNKAKLSESNYRTTSNYFLYFLYNFVDPRYHMTINIIIILYYEYFNI